MFEDEIMMAQEAINQIMSLSAFMAESCACMLCDEIAKMYKRDAVEVAEEVAQMVRNVNAELGAY